MGKITLGDGQSRELAAPLSRLVARGTDTFLALIVVALLYGGASYFWGLPGDGFRSLWEVDARGSPSETQVESRHAAHRLSKHCAQFTGCSGEARDVEVVDAAKSAESDSTDSSFSDGELVLLIASLSLYELICLAGMGQGRSPGRALAGIRVVRFQDGRALSWREAINRWSVLGIGFSLLLLWPDLREDWRAIAIAAVSGGTILLSRTRQGWHDMAADSVVVRQARRRPLSVAQRWAAWAKRVEKWFIAVVTIACVVMLAILILTMQRHR
ncbi:RDD family protein [Candidatus Poriferisodalis sp.]|uniref:RDD family protein n=1 Tax=Candidatus Poriferisodalis sp. TaxID=3101277 RepID=UPI003B528E4E